MPAAGPARAQVDRFVYAGDHAFPPHEYIDEDGHPAGFNVDVIRLLAQESGTGVEVRLGPWSEQLAAFERGDADVMSLAYSELRAERYAWLVQIWTLRQGLLFRPGRARYPASLDELAGEVVAVERDGGVHERLLALPEARRPGIHAVASHREAALKVASPEPDWVEIRVEDPGPGFTQEALEHGFEPFYSQRQGGTGLGLAVVERITAGHGGRVGAHNRSAGGAAVWIRLPVPPADAAQASTP